ncbi:MAG: 4Fe-4S binding protein [Oscillospiraceae bacterium]
MGLTPAQVPTLQAACQRGLIPSSLQDLAFFGNPDAFQQKDFQVAPIPASLLFRDTLRGRWGNAFSTVAARCLTAKPKLHTGRCTGCGQCARICPARAITLRSGKPVINRSACIRCFCCQEFCPQGAMRIARPLPARILNP